jgi:hypothetical protein
MGSIKGIVIHWTAGTYTPNATDKEHYHFLIDGNGKVIEGKYKPNDNLNCKDGKYAAHCGGGNTGRIGIALCACHSDEYPVKRLQLEALCKKCAELSKVYGIPITNNTILTHSEFGHKNPHTTSFGKIDIDKLPCIALYDRVSVGNWLRNKINWYRSKM